MKMINATPHDVAIFGEDQVIYIASIRKHVLKPGATPKAYFPKSGTLLSVQFAEDEVNSLLTQELGVPVASPVIESLDAADEGVAYIVSALYGSEAVKRFPGVFLGVNRPVYDSVENPKPVGCLGLKLF